MMRNIFPFLLVLTFLLVSCGESTPTPIPTTAVLSEISGTVKLRNPADADFSTAADGDTLLVDGQIQTGDDGRVRVDLSTGSLIRVGPSTTFLLTANDEAETGLLTRLKLETGRLWISLNGGEVEVETPSGVASVRGSHLSVWIDPLTNVVRAACIEGMCAVANAAGVLDLVAGQGGMLDPDMLVDELPPQLYLLSETEMDEFFNNNPEALAVIDAIQATMTALPPLPEPTLPAPGDCFQLIAPEDGKDIAGSGVVLFQWEEMPGASSYSLEIFTPGASLISLFTSVNSYELDLLGLPEAGMVAWSVTAFDYLYRPLCTAGPWIFNKSTGTAVTLDDPDLPAGCIDLVAPADGFILPDDGWVNFAWSAHPQAENYALTFVQPDALSNHVITTDTELFLGAEIFYLSGDYTWMVTVLDENDTGICTSTLSGFTRSGDEFPTPELPDFPTEIPTELPTEIPTDFPTDIPEYPTDIPTFTFVPATSIPTFTLVPPTSIPTFTLVPPTNIPTFTLEPPTDVPTPENTPAVFSNISGPTDPYYNCDATFSVDVYDPDGVASVTVSYNVYDPGTATYVYYGSQPMMQVGSTWSAYVSNFPGLMPGYDIQWWFWAMDGYGIRTDDMGYSSRYDGNTCNLP